MPNLTRAFVDNACYHVTTRGNQKQTVFREEDDYRKYLEVLKRAMRKYDIQVYSYCLMCNHVHLLIEPKSGRAISKFMQWMNRGYAAYFNTKYEAVGHLWQGRFRSKPILKDEYLINCALYIEANPVRAGLVEDLAKYEWSSYKERCLSSGKKITDEILVASRTVETMGDTVKV
jgi:putative transposase